MSYVMGRRRFLKTNLYENIVRINTVNLSNFALYKDNIKN